jgi:hypothetical protein
MTTTNEAEPSQDSSCPQCASTNLRRRQSGASVAAWIGAFVVLFILLLGASGSYSGASKPNPVLGILIFMVIVVGIGAVLAPISFAAGKNRCKDCGHKWR